MPKRKPHFVFRVQGLCSGARTGVLDCVIAVGDLLVVGSTQEACNELAQAVVMSLHKADT